MRVFRLVVGDQERLSLIRPLQWWRTGLLACLPSALKQQWFPGRMRYVLDILSPDLLRVSRENGGGTEVLGECRRGETQRLQDLCGLALQKGLDLVFRISAKSAFFRRVGLPSAAAENLRQVIEFEMDRLTPFTSSDVYFDFRILEAGNETTPLIVNLALVPRKLIDPWLDVGTAAGLSVAGLIAEGGWDGMNLLDATRRRKGLGGTGVNWGLSILVGLMSLVVLGIPLWQKRSIAMDLEREVAQLSPQANVVAELRTKLEKAVKASQYLVEKRENTLFTLDVLLEATRILPDTTWAEQLEYHNGILELRGESENAAALIGVLSASNMFTDIGFRSPVVQQQGSNRERFHIAAQVQGKGK